MTERRNSMLQVFLCSSDRKCRRPLPRRKPHPSSSASPLGGMSSPPPKFPFKRFTKILGQKTRSAKESFDNLATGSLELWSKARRRIFPRATLSRQFYLQQARLSASSMNHADISAPSVTSLAGTDATTVATATSFGGLEPALECILHPAREPAERISIVPCEPGKSILKSFQHSIHHGLCAAEEETIANTSLNLLMTFQKSALKSRASTGSLHSRMRRSAMSKDPSSINRTHNSPAGILAMAKNEYRPSNPGCHCLTGCVCRVLERYFLNIIPDHSDSADEAGKEAPKKSRGVSFGHADIYPISPVGDSGDEWSLYADYSWLDEMETAVEDYGDDILDLLETYDSDEDVLNS
ncbi:predicted protein [Uncinocarpus reesii 1704]|uniref:Uncharacterized protein n=1 Tax=Uncinocarpus reesii (strain UAMH 1704) TaxID=336963 RepID=C4JDZ9_UNCRE|nr:uncharacterized protein UREG_00423 [Uncinocarpus reesii 1704]EEP75577.1 predicted protein [Uncinocarpus reesii 1704]